VVRDAGTEDVRGGEVGKWLKTPAGWARANLLLRTLQAPPSKGSLQEWALIFLLDKLEDIEHARYLALVQVLINKEEGVKAFGDYMKIAFPSLALRKNQKEEETKAVLNWWTKRGPMKITPLAPLTLKSKLKTRVVQVNQDEKTNEFYRDLGDPLGRLWHSQKEKSPSAYAPIAGASR